jgi:hypothetical protein
MLRKLAIWLLVIGVVFLLLGIQFISGLHP